MPKIIKIFSLKIHKQAGIFEKPITFLNEGTEHKKNYVECLNSKNKNNNFKGGPSHYVKSSEKRLSCPKFVYNYIYLGTGKRSLVIFT